MCIYVDQGTEMTQRVFFQSSACRGSHTTATSINPQTSAREHLRSLRRLSVFVVFKQPLVQNMSMKMNS